jgi:hypothetical protein
MLLILSISLGSKDPALDIFWLSENRTARLGRIIDRETNGRYVDTDNRLEQDRYLDWTMSSGLYAYTPRRK